MKLMMWANSKSYILLFSSLSSPSLCFYLVLFIVLPLLFPPSLFSSFFPHLSLTSESLLLPSLSFEDTRDGDIQKDEIVKGT